MSTPIPISPPDSIVAGTTLKYRRSLPQYAPVDGWSLEFVLGGRNETPLQFTATADGAGYLIALDPSQTATIAAGVYTWQERVTDGTDVYVVNTGRMTVTPDLTAAGAHQEWAELMLEAIEVKLGLRVAGDVERYAVVNRSLEHIPFDKLWSVRNQIKGELASVARGGQFSREVIFSFTGVGFRS